MAHAMQGKCIAETAKAPLKTQIHRDHPLHGISHAKHKGVNLPTNHWHTKFTK
jgi:hypothetical protein